ncbi:MAG: DUF3782 domain-containing protein [Anaerolineales bacterium]
MTAEELREIIMRELPKLVTQDPQIRDWVWHLIHDYAPSRAETESRFDQMLAELKQMREEQERRWEEQQRRWDEQQKRWDEQQKRWEENQRRLEENERRLDALIEEERRRWDEQQQRWEEQQKRWEENQRQLNALIEEIKKVDHRIDTTLGAIGARWGASSEAAFRNALAGILEKSFGVKVERVEYKDESGEVFGHPDMVELDVLIHNGEVLICEIKSSVSRSDVYTFERKVRSYEKRFGRKVNRMLLISPMVLDADRKLAQSLGMEVYSDATQVVP